MNRFIYFFLDISIMVTFKSFNSQFLIVLQFLMIGAFSPISRGEWQLVPCRSRLSVSFRVSRRIQNSSHNAVPSWVIFFIEFFLNEGRDVLFDIELFQWLVGAIDGVLLHLLRHVGVLNDCFSISCGHWFFLLSLFLLTFLFFWFLFVFFYNSKRSI